MICPRCGTQLPDTVTICFNCKTTFQNNNQMSYSPQNQQMGSSDPRNNPIFQNNAYPQQNMQQGMNNQTYPQMNNQHTGYNGQVPNKNKMPKKTKIIIGVSVFVLLCIIAGASRKGGNNDTPTRNSANATTESKNTEAVTEEKSKQENTTEKVTEEKTEEVKNETEEVTEQDTEEITEEKAEAEDKRPDDEISTDFKEYMDSYEAFMDEYCEFLEKYNADSTNAELMNEYSEFLLKYNDFSEKINEYNKNQSTMTTAESKYYIEVMNRVNTKLLKVSQEMDTSGN